MLIMLVGWITFFVSTYFPMEKVINMNNIFDKNTVFNALDVDEMDLIATILTVDNNIVWTLVVAIPSFHYSLHLEGYWNSWIVYGHIIFCCSCIGNNIYKKGWASYFSICKCMLLDLWDLFWAFHEYHENENQ